jgi:transketolase
VPELLAPEPFRIGAVRPVLDGGETALVGTGLGTAWALEAAALLDGRVSLLHVPTLKPVDEDALAAWCARFPSVTTVENHSTVGGLGTVVCEAVARRGLPVRVRTLGAPDRWAPAGSLDHIRAELGLDARSIAETVS